MGASFVPNGLSWLFLDLNSYFASVEQQDNPDLRGKPIAVVPLETDATCAIAASYEAKAFGVKTGTKIYDAKKMCPGLICVPARHDRYVHYHHKILEETARHVPINKVWSIDELSSRLPPRLRRREAAIEVAQRLKKGLCDNIGPSIKCSIGIASNSFLAKVATDMQKPNGLVVLEPADFEKRLFKLKLRDLPGISARMEERLQRAHVNTTADLWRLEPKQARAIWGSVAGERFWYNLHGYSVPDTETKTSSFGHSRVLDLDLRSSELAKQVSRRLLVKAASRLRRKGFLATTFYLGVRDVGDHKWSRETKLPPTDDNSNFLAALDVAWLQMESDLRPMKLKKVAVTLAGLQLPQTITGDLFAKVGGEAHCKTAIVSRVMDKINAKFGGEAISLGVSPKTSAGYVGTKIAFSRIPDLEEFYE